MCRFIAYIGKERILLNELIDKPENSLINQSRQAKEGRLGLNADGFGLAWYDHAVNTFPGVFKSIQPAWNDNNLKHLASKVKSNCFLSHVRASTIGDVVFNNCHPFTHDKYAFVHNGTIRHFEKIRRHVINELDDLLFEEVKAQTDSEHLFFLIMQYMKKDSANCSMEKAVISAFAKIMSLQEKDDNEHFSRLNIALTDGENLIATRYVSKNQEPLSLYYATGQSIDAAHDETLMLEGKKTGAIVIASEPLTDYLAEWHEIPLNHYLFVNSKLKPTIKAFENVVGDKSQVTEMPKTPSTSI
ncbi:class II glutamine amidotransferase [Facilibium subflavum]|uniref:class II glutamine amidotransferase n=1 Tax=Facilibium subflavum TaxID=2219058 RepID=UPI0013C34E4B|nr:class II glutamine amidotransferase [Facilibium subflavum]